MPTEWIFLASPPIVNRLFCFVFSDAVDFLNLAGKVFALTAPGRVLQTNFLDRGAEASLFFANGLSWGRAGCMV